MMSKSKLNPNAPVWYPSTQRNEAQYNQQYHNNSYARNEAQQTVNINKNIL